MSACPAPDELTSLALRHLDLAEASRLQAHVDRCPLCRAALDAWIDLIGELPLAERPTPPPPELKRRILGALTPQEAEATPWHSRLLTRWVGLVATFALLLGGYSLWQVERISPQTVVLKGVGLGQGASAQVTLYTEGTGTRMAITTAGLPPLTQNEVYRLWVLKDGEREAVCAFKVDASGHGDSTYWLPGKLSFDALGVTREPDETYTEEPRGPKVLGS